MITVELYEIGEKVLIQAAVTDIVVDQGKIKYKLRVEHTNTELENSFTEHQMQPMPTMLKKETIEETEVLTDRETTMKES